MVFSRTFYTTKWHFQDPPIQKMHFRERPIKQKDIFETPYTPYFCVPSSLYKNGQNLTPVQKRPKLGQKWSTFDLSLYNKMAKILPPYTKNGNFDTTYTKNSIFKTPYTKNTIFETLRITKCHFQDPYTTKKAFSRPPIQQNGILETS